VLESVLAVNAEQIRRTCARLSAALDGTLEGRRIALLGLAFKPQTDDVRGSPALIVAAKIRAEGAAVRVHDPKAIENARLAVPDLDYADNVIKACEGADVILHLTEWQE